MTNPLLTRSRLPYELPPFAELTAAHYAPAFDRGMAEQLAEVAAIAADPAPPSFENTVVALERSGALLRRVEAVFGNHAATGSTEEIQRLDAEYRPRLAAHRDAVLLDRRLFARLDALHRERHQLGLDDASLRLLERVHTDFVRAGARLDDAGQRRLRGLNEELAVLSATFERNLLADTAAATVLFDTADELRGLAPDAVAAAALSAESLGHPGRYAIRLKLFTNQSELAQLDDPAARERLFTASVSRGRESNRQIVPRIARLRAQRAALLGYPSHAAYVVAEMTAGTIEAVGSLLARLIPPAVANARREEATLTEAAGRPLEPWDWSYWTERVRGARYTVDAAALRPYLELERVLADGVFLAAEQLYGVRLTERHDLPGYHPDVRVFEVTEANGAPLGLFLADFYARPGKRGGAWMDQLVPQSGLLDQRPVVVNNLNIARPPHGEPTLLTLDEVRTLFHEFGHALHGLFSDVRYPYFSGTRVPRDVVEYPSQVNEVWMLRPEVLSRYARHHLTGEPLPGHLVAALEESRRFGEGFATVEYLAAAALDWAWHTLGAGDDPGDPEAFEAAALEAAGVALPLIPPRYRSTYFAHVFGGDYSAGYYAYIWSEVLDADTVEWFTGRPGPLRETGALFRRELLAKGGSADVMECFRRLTGRSPRIEPLLARRGLS
ncbi:MULTISPECIES: M3 family metallopeptidase [Streptomycetaceae]|uniref:Putative peptidase n=1 Tax=Streptantibioticus cattleyicolor (strain ATCC 35852 / DSM 46488 / JCM 4925 / NBRC 14057 / NRRL 8057) TaxID=1003195 RepID=F8JZL4_STREN|nr:MULTISPECIES: M3 family metallopeptidase [Streptomycetaceae]AEW97315.1 putative peptidase [Streptantibioticus cattleyicolor NRRL 8057 = DSM 46488]MYS61767.1 M3 family peptidase [Streptomyces sp. SID5468]CCB77637.1 Peptidyl-dipeptidase dcp [Streptantibioticus cattleyicolor NRRL 8057 = DSM 46488]